MPFDIKDWIEDHIIISQLKKTLFDWYEEINARQDDDDDAVLLLYVAPAAHVHFFGFFSILLMISVLGIL